MNAATFLLSGLTLLQPEEGPYKNCWSNGNIIFLFKVHFSVNDIQWALFNFVVNPPDIFSYQAESK